MSVLQTIRDQKPDTATAQVAVTMAFALGFGVLAVFFSLWNNGTIWHGLLWAGAWSAVGWFLGFIFGIPRYLSTDTARTPTASSLETAKADLQANADKVKELRDAAIQADKAKADADTEASQAAQTADQAIKASAEATMKFEADPQNAQLKVDADTKKAVAESAKSDSDNASSRAQKKQAEAEHAGEASTTAEEDVKTATAKLDEEKKKPASSASSLTVNTNLEQISDWLTKIIVGVSLVESQTLLNKMRNAATFMSKSIMKVDQELGRVVSASHPTVAASVQAATDSASAAAGSVSAAAVSASSVAAITQSLESLSAESFAYAIMLYFLVTGLLGSYLLTRLFLQTAFDKVANAVGRT